MILGPRDVGRAGAAGRRSEAIAVRVSAAANPRVSIEGDGRFNNPDDSDRSQ